MARLQNADALLAAGNTDQAIALYKKIAAGDDPLLAAVARLREGWALVETTPRLQMETLLAPLTDPTSAWRYMAREILAYADYRAGKFAAAQKEYETLAAETKAPIGVRQRADAMMSFLKAGGDKDYGTVPPPKPAAATQTPAGDAAKAKPAAAKPTSKKGRAKK